MSCNYQVLDEAIAYLDGDDNALLEAMYKSISAFRYSEMIFEGFDLEAIKSNIKKFVEFVVEKIKAFIKFLKEKIFTFFKKIKKFILSLKLKEKYKKFKEKKNGNISEAVGSIYDEIPGTCVIMNPKAVLDILSDIKKYESDIEKRYVEPGRLRIETKNNLSSKLISDDSFTLYEKDVNFKFSLHIDNEIKTYDFLINVKAEKLISENILDDIANKMDRVIEEMKKISDSLKNEGDDLKSKADNPKSDLDREFADDRREEGDAILMDVANINQLIELITNHYDYTVALAAKINNFFKERGIFA